MHIAFEINSILTNRYSGFFTYGAGLLAGFGRLAQPPEFTLWCGNKFAANKQWLDDSLGSLTVDWHFSSVKMRWLGAWWRQFGFPKLERFVGEFDLYHCNHHLMPATKSKPRLLTVHDLRRYRFPEFYRHSKLGVFENAVRVADHFIAISEATKNDLQDIFGITAEKIDVVYHGGPIPAGDDRNKECDEGEGEGEGENVLKHFGLQENRYFVIFSSYDRRKNIDRMVRAFELATERLADDYHLVIVGRLPRDEESFKGQITEKTAEKIIFTGPIENLTGILHGAVGLVYASLYEGFGLPILEAMAAGTAVISSNCSSMPEVAGSAGLLIDPQSTEQIAKTMVQLAQDDNLRDRLIEAGAQQAKKFSWTKAAQETLAVYQKLI